MRERASKLWPIALSPASLADALDVPRGWTFIAYLCIGYVPEFPERPILESAQWAERLPPRSLLHFDSWDSTGEQGKSLTKALESAGIWSEIFR